MLVSLRADEAHLTPLAVGPVVLLAMLQTEARSDRQADLAGSRGTDLHVGGRGLVAEAAARLDEIRRFVGVKRGGTQAISAAALEKESVRAEMAQAGLIFDFPSLEMKAPMESEAAPV